MNEFEVGDIVYIDSQPLKVIVKIVEVDKIKTPGTVEFRYKIMKYISTYIPVGNTPFFEKNSYTYRNSYKIGKLGYLLYG